VRQEPLFDSPDDWTRRPVATCGRCHKLGRTTYRGHLWRNTRFGVALFRCECGLEWSESQEYQQ